MLALLPILMSLAPSLIGAIAGDRAGTVTGQAIEIAKTLTGTDTPDAAAAVLASDPAAATELSLALAKIAADAKTAQAAEETTRLKAALDDTANARAAGASTPLIARTQVALAAGIIGMFALVLIMMATRGIPEGSESLFNILLGALIAGQTAVVSFFFGNSTSGHAANNAMAAALARPPAAGQQGRG
jgi:hypothetical protein